MAGKRREISRPSNKSSKRARRKVLSFRVKNRRPMTGHQECATTKGDVKITRLRKPRYGGSRCSWARLSQAAPNNKKLRNSRSSSASDCWPHPAHLCPEFPQPSVPFSTTKPSSVSGSKLTRAVSSPKRPTFLNLRTKKIRAVSFPRRPMFLRLRLKKGRQKPRNGKLAQRFRDLELLSKPGRLDARGNEKGCLTTFTTTVCRKPRIPPPPKQAASWIKSSHLFFSFCTGTMALSPLRLRAATALRRRCFGNTFVQGTKLEIKLNPQPPHHPAVNLATEKVNALEKISLLRCARARTYKLTIPYSSPNTQTG